MLPLELTPAAVQLLRDSGKDLVLVDCRERDEWELVAIADAQLLPMSEIADRVSELAGYEEARLVVYCHLGGRSLRVATWLRSLGFSHAQSMRGGIDQWAAEIEPGMARY